MFKKLGLRLLLVLGAVYVSIIHHQNFVYARVTERAITFSGTTGHRHDGTTSKTGGKKISSGDITSTPAGDISSTNIQDAVNELDTEKIPLTQKGAASGVATLDSGTKIVTSQLPAIAITDIYSPADEAAQLALGALQGDIAIRGDTGDTWIHNGGTTNTMADWDLMTLTTDHIMIDGSSVFTGDQSHGDFSISNVGDIALDTISSDSGTTVNVTLGADAGDDFTIDTDKFVVEGDTGNIGIGTATPSTGLEIKNKNLYLNSGTNVNFDLGRGSSANFTQFRFLTGGAQKLAMGNKGEGNDTFYWYDSSNNKLFSFDQAGRMGINKVTPTTSMLTIVPATTARNGFMIEGSAGQTADLIKIKNDSLVDMFTIGQDGKATFQNDVNSSVGFEVLNADGTVPIIRVNTTNRAVGMGKSPGGVQLDVNGDVWVGKTGSAGSVSFARANDGGYQGGVGYWGASESSNMSISSAGGGAYITSIVNGVVGLKVKPPTITIGSGETGVDYQLFFDGETNDGIITWMEDEDYFQFSKPISGADEVLVSRPLSTDTAFSARVDGDANPRHLVEASGKIWFGDGTSTVDNYIERGGGGLLKTNSRIRYIQSDILNRIITGMASSDPAISFAIEAGGVMDWGDGTAALDTNLYRSAVDTLKTDGHFHVGKSIHLDLDDATWGLIFGSAEDTNLYRSAANTLETGDEFVSTGLTVKRNDSSASFQTLQSGDTNSRFQVSGDGTIAWGSGAAALDVLMFRSSANNLTLQAGDTLTTGSDASSYAHAVTSRYLTISAPGGVIPTTSNGISVFTNAISPSVSTGVTNYGMATVSLPIGSVITAINVYGGTVDLGDSFTVSLVSRNTAGTSPITHAWCTAADGVDSCSDTTITTPTVVVGRGYFLEVTMFADDNMNDSQLYHVKITYTTTDLSQLN